VPCGVSIYGLLPCPLESELDTELLPHLGFQTAECSSSSARSDAATDQSGPASSRDGAGSNAARAGVSMQRKSQTGSQPVTESAGLCLGNEVVPGPHAMHLAMGQHAGAHRSGSLAQEAGAWRGGGAAESGWRKRHTTAIAVAIITARRKSSASPICGVEAVCYSSRSSQLPVLV